MSEPAADRVPTAELDERFSEPGATARPWSDVLDVLTGSEMFWLSTVRRDGRPHVTPLPAVWHAGALHLCCGAEEQKGKNLQADPRCVLTTGTNDLHEGLDVVVEGSAVAVGDEPLLHELAALWLAKLDWRFEVADGGFREADGHPAVVYAVAPEKVLAFGKGPYSQTRYRFAD